MSGKGAKGFLLLSALAPPPPPSSVLLPLVSCPSLSWLVQGTRVERKSHLVQFLCGPVGLMPRTTDPSGPPRSPSRQSLGPGASPPLGLLQMGRQAQACGPPALSAQPRPQSPACRHLPSLPGGALRARCQAPDNTPECETAHLLPGAPCVFRPGQAQWGHGVTAKEQPPRARVQVGVGVLSWVSVQDNSPEDPGTPRAGRRQSPSPLRLCPPQTAPRGWALWGPCF